MTEFEKFVEKYLSMRRQYPNWRIGQCLYNALHETHPKTAEEIHGGSLDTFYRDHETDKPNMIAFWTWVYARLG